MYNISYHRTLYSFFSAVAEDSETDSQIYNDDSDSDFIA